MSVAGWALVVFISVVGLTAVAFLVWERANGGQLQQRREETLLRAKLEVVLRETNRKDLLSRRLDLLIRHHPVTPSVDAWLCIVRDYVPDLEPSEEEWCRNYLRKRGYARQGRYS